MRVKDRYQPANGYLTRIFFSEFRTRNSLLFARHVAHVLLKTLGTVEGKLDLTAIFYGFSYVCTLYNNTSRGKRDYYKPTIDFGSAGKVC